MTMRNSLYPRIRSIILAALFVSPFWPVVIFALSPDKAITQYNQSNWQTEQGLPQNSIRDILQTRDGYIWFGTEEGVVRFDGVSFTIFDKKNTDGITHNYVNQMLEGNDGTLWIATNGGLTRYKDGEFTTYTSKNGFVADHVFALTEDHQGSIWLLTPDSGLPRLKDGKITVYTTKDGLSSNRVQSIVEDREGTLWIGTRDGGLNQLKDGRFKALTTKDGLASDNVVLTYQDQARNIWISTDHGLNKLRDGQLTTYGSKDGLPEQPVTQILEGFDGSLWMATAVGLVRFKDEKFISYVGSNPLERKPVTRLFEDQEGSLWIASYGGGLARFRGGQFTYYTTKEGLSDDKVRTIFEDRERNLWIGTVTGGLAKLQDGEFTTYGTKEGLADEVTWAVYEGRDGSVWIGTGQGLNRFKDGQVTVYTTKDGLSDNVVFSINESRDGSLWIGTRGGGLNHFKDGKFKAYTTKDGLDSNSVRAIVEDRAGNIWIGTNSGLSELKDGKLLNYSLKDGLPSNIIKTIHQGHDDRLWFGTTSGLSCFNDGKFTNYTVKDGLSHNTIYSIYEDPDGVLWFGTAGGLNRFKDGKFTPYTTERGLFNDTIWSILEDDRGNLWMSCNKGIFRVSKKELNDYAEGKTKAVTSIAYGVADGMRSAECTGGGSSHAYKSRDRRLWFTTINGVVVIDPNHLKVNSQAPPVKIERVLSSKTPLDLRGTHQIGPGKGELEVHYTALSYTNSEHVRFKYKLEGYDKDWVDAGNRREAYYTNLPPGEYNFRVIAVNSYGVGSETGASFAFYLQPHFYQTNWFLAICVSALLFSGFGFYRFRLLHLRQRARELEVLVDQRTVELKVSQRKVLALEKEATEQQMAGGFAHEMRNALAGSQLMLDQALALDGPEPRLSLSLANCHALKEIYLDLKPTLKESELRNVLEKMQTIFANEERLNQILQLVRKATTRGLSITQQILEYAKLGQQRPGRQAVILNELISGIMDESREEFLSQGVSLEYKSDGASIRLIGDETQFYWVIKNLILNARDALTDSAITTCSNRRIEITTSQEGDSCRVIVADNGVGISEENLEKIFEPFFSTKPATGTGLGLGMVKKIVSLYKGRIDVNSEVGKWTSFAISLPHSPHDSLGDMTPREFLLTQKPEISTYG